MTKKLEDILNEALAPELKAHLQEAFDKKVEEMRDQVAADMANRFEHDKAQLVEAMDRMLSDVVRVHEETKAEEIAKLREARERYETSSKAAKTALRARIAEMANVSGKLINESLTKEISKLRVQKGEMLSMSEKLAEDVAAVKNTLAENHEKHLAKINDFITRNLRKELVEFEQDKRALIETRVKLISESKQKLAETQKKFVSEAAKKVEATVTDTLKREMVQLHEDLERNRQNSFGRKIFEAVAAEFQMSYLAEGTEMRKLQKIVESKDAELAAERVAAETAKRRLAEAAKAQAETERKVALAEGRAERTKIMSELMSNLKGDKRAVMESMLETTKTSQLRAAFNKLLPVVLNEGARKAPTTGKKVLTENPVPKAAAATTVTGDRAGRVLEESQEDIQNDKEIAAILHLAGVRK